MINKIFLVLSLLFICIHAAHADEYNIIGCEVYDMNKKLIRRYPGRICVFMEDGSLLSTQKENLVYYDKLRNIIWSKKINPHHQINLSLDKNSFLVLGSDVKKIKNSIVRYDVLYVISKQGEIVKKFDLYNSKSQFLKKNLDDALKRKYSKIKPSDYFQQVDWELTHTNSFYEIPANTIVHKFKAFEKGNYIVNDISLMLVFVLSADLKKILWQSPILNEEWTMLHDVQVMPDSDSLLFYDNGSPLRTFSRLVEFDLVKSEIKWQYPKTFTPSFYSKTMGGIQILKNGNILYTDLSAIPTASEVTREGTLVWSLNPHGQLNSKDDEEPIQQVKRMDITDFLKKHRGL